MDESRAVLCEANSGAIRFQVKSISGYAQFHLSAINPPHKDLFSICLSRQSRIVDNEIPSGESYLASETEFINLRQYQEFWITWYNGSLRIGLADQNEPFLKYEYDNSLREIVGYIKFDRNCATNHIIQWIYEKPPIISKVLQPKKLAGGELRWETIIDNRLPPDALVGGFEKEPLYIACALHRDSMCPGKYVPSQRRALVPWGGREHVKEKFQILCGYNASWVKAAGGRIPQNAFIGGISEVRQEPLYIGRAVHDGYLINGKIHVLYRTCYLPYQGKEIEVHSFEVLVLPDEDYRGVLAVTEPVVN